MEDYFGGGQQGGGGGGGGKAASSSASSASAINFGASSDNGGLSPLAILGLGAVALLAFVALIIAARK